jgi:hypothetical protein
MFPFLRVGATSGNDPNDLIGAFNSISMDGGDYDSSVHCPDRVPAFLAMLYAFDKRQAIRIVEHQCRSFEPDAMFCPVYFIFFLIPLKPKHLQLGYRGPPVLCAMVGWIRCPHTALFYFRAAPYHVFGRATAPRCSTGTDEHQADCSDFREGQNGGQTLIF